MSTLDMLKSFSLRAMNFYLVHAPPISLCIEVQCFLFVPLHTCLIHFNTLYLILFEIRDLIFSKCFFLFVNMNVT